MDVFEAISGRRSIREFKKENVSDELIRKVVNAGIWAPSAGNVQAWEVIIVQDEEKGEKYLKQLICVILYLKHR